jgi:WD40 repeat protein
VIRSGAFSPDGKILAVGHGYGNIRLWDVATQKITAGNQPMSVTSAPTARNRTTNRVGARATLSNDANT